MNKNEKPVAVHSITNRFAQPIAGEFQIKLRHGLTSSRMLTTFDRTRDSS